MTERRYWGTILNISQMPGEEGLEIGREHWETTVHNRLRTLRSRCRLEETGWPPLMRDVLQSVDAEYHPHDGFARLMLGGEFRGSAWYRFDGDVALCEADTPVEGRITQRFKIDRSMRGFGTHSLQCDGWLVARYDLGQGPGRQRFERNLMTSIDHRGSTGPMFMTTYSSLEYSGIETVTVPAGTFECHHFAFVGTSNAHPPYNLWVTTDGNFHFILGVLDGERKKRFELIEYREQVL